MTETPTVGTPGAGGNQPPVSEPPIEGEAERLSKLFDAKLSDALKPVLAEVRGVQSRQDKDRKGFQEVLDEFKKLKAKGLSDEEAENAMIEGRKASEKDDLLFKMAQKLGVLDSTSAQPAGNSVSRADATDADIQRLKLDPNDAQVLKIRQDISDPDERLAAFVTYKKSLAPRAPDPSAAPVMPSAPAQTGAVNRETLKRDYIAEMQKNRGNKNAIRSIQEQFKKKGLDIENIGFGI